MSLAPNLRDLLEGHIDLELESIDRLYLNGYVPQLQHGAAPFLCPKKSRTRTTTRTNGGVPKPRCIHTGFNQVLTREPVTRGDAP
jgi:hypothetical protein